MIRTRHTIQVEIESATPIAVGDLREFGILVRFLRLRDAPRYLGMDRNRFNNEVRPYLTEFPIGQQGIAFDRLELDAWADNYVLRKGRPPERSLAGQTSDTSDQAEQSQFEKVAARVIASRKRYALRSV